MEGDAGDDEKNWKFSLLPDFESFLRQVLVCDLTRKLCLSGPLRDLRLALRLASVGSVRFDMRSWCGYGHSDSVRTVSFATTGKQVPGGTGPSCFLSGMTADLARSKFPGPVPGNRPRG